MTGERPDPTDGFDAPFRVRFDEAAPDGRLRTSTLLRYAQDLAWAHSAALGFDRSWYAGRRLTWLVRAAELTVAAPVVVGATLTGTTRVVGFRRVWSRRRSTFADDSGHEVARVDIDWVLLDDSGAPTRIPPSIESIFEAPTATPVRLGRVTLPDPPTDAVVATIRVRPQELDPMDHVNNAVYADWVDEAVIAAGDVDATRAIPRTARLEYAKAAGPRASLAIVAWRDEDGWACRVRTSDGADVLRARLSG